MIASEFEIIGWRRRDRIRLILYRIFSAFSVAILPLFCFYFPVYFDILTSTASDPGHADLVVIKLDGKKQALQVHPWEGAVDEEGSPIVSIELDCVRYFALREEGFRFRKVRDVPRNFTRFLGMDYVSDHAPQEMIEEQSIIRVQYGLNVMKIPESSFSEIAIRHMLSPFYLFQYFAAAVWYAEDYWLYATLILIITFGAIYVTSRESLSNLQSLRMLAGSDSMVQALPAETDRTTYEINLQGRDVQLVSDRQLLPGRKFKVTENMTLPCDAILISGKVVMDESMLTGESVPVSKVPLDTSDIEGDKSYVLSMDRLSLKSKKLKNSRKNQRKPSKKSKRYVETSEEDSGSEKDDIEQGELEDTFIENTALKQPHLIADDELAIKRSGSVLFGGTRVKACYGSECIAVVYRTGFRSAKGMLVASLLKPKDGFINFVSDALWVLLFMLILSTVMYFAVAIRIIESGASGVSVFYHYLDTITIAVPPALTACLTVATAISIGRLKKVAIFVSDTSRVNFAGVVNSICFDKTGTLTEDKLTFVGYQTPMISSRTGVSMDEWMDFNRDNEQILPLRCQEIMATCHALSLFGFDDNLTPVGDPLEVELLNASGWDLKPSETVPGQLIACPPMDNIVLEGEVLPDEDYVILKHFEFTPDRLRAASIVQEPSGHLMYLIKGSPEVIIKLCSPSTVPHSIQQTMASLTKRGFRVIATAYRDLRTKSVEAVQAMTQEECEADHSNGQHYTVFAGLLYLSNELKADSKRTIRALHQAHLHTNMITGDHVFTAIAVAKQCHILSPDLSQQRQSMQLNNQSIAEGVKENSMICGTAVSKKASTGKPPLHKPVVIKPALDEVLPASVLMMNSNPQAARFTLIIDENETIRGELCIKDYDSGLLVDIDLYKCAAMAAKTVYRTIMKRYRKKVTLQKANGKSTGTGHYDSDDNTTIAGDAHAKKLPSRKDNSKSKLSNKQKQQQKRLNGKDKLNIESAVLNPLLLPMETHTPFLGLHSDSPGVSSSSPNSSKIDISLMSFSNFGLGSSTSNSNNVVSNSPPLHLNQNTNNTSNNNVFNSSIHSVRSTTSSKSDYGGQQLHYSHHGGANHPFRLLHHNRHPSTSAGLPEQSQHSRHSPASSHHSLMSLRQTTTGDSSSVQLVPITDASSAQHQHHIHHRHSDSRSPTFHRPVLLQLPPGAQVELAITGKALHLIRQQYSYPLYQKLIRYAKVFARMKPHDKREVVETMLETLEYKVKDMSLKYCEDTEEDAVESHDNNTYNKYMSTALFPLKFQSTNNVDHRVQEEEPLVNELDQSAIVGIGTVDQSFLSVESGSLLDRDEALHDPEIYQEHHQHLQVHEEQPQQHQEHELDTDAMEDKKDTSGLVYGSKSLDIAGTMQDRRRRKASMLTSVLHKTADRHRSLSSASTSTNITQPFLGFHLPPLQAEEEGEHGAAMMMFPTLPHNHFEVDLESQDYPPISHVNYHHPLHLPTVHQQCLPGDQDIRSRTQSFSTITSHPSVFSAARNGQYKQQLSRRNETSSMEKAMSSFAAVSSSTAKFFQAYVTDTLAGTPPASENLEVLFCGDGANDMIALRAATVGISLCDAETSVAAPITSRQATPYSVVQVLREGRCSLITAYVLILFNIMYGTIQLFMVCALYFYGLIPGNYMYLQQDLCYTLVLGLAISYSLPSKALDHLLPPKRFLSRRFLVQLSLLLLSFVVFQLLSLWMLYLHQDTFYTPYEATTAFTETYSYEASTTQAMALGQLMIASVVSSLGEPFRLPWHLNGYHMYILLIQTAWLLFQIFSQDNYLLQDILEIKPFPVNFGFILVGLLILNGLVAMGIVSYVEDHIAPMTSRRWFEVCAMKQSNLRRERKRKLLQEQEEEYIYNLRKSQKGKLNQSNRTQLAIESTRGAKYPLNKDNLSTYNNHLSTLSKKSQKRECSADSDSEEEDKVLHDRTRLLPKK